MEPQEGTKRAGAPWQAVTESPVLVRAAPFVLFVLLTACQDFFGEAGKYWVYLGKTLLGAWMVWVMRPFVLEMRWKFSWEAVAAGIAVFVIWVGIDSPWTRYGKPGAAWNPFGQFGAGSGLAWMFVLGRIIGSTLVVPPLEEVFYRSFLHRYLAKPDFQSVPLNHFALVPFLAAAALFGFAHREWLAGILCAFIYQGLVLRKNRLGDAMTAHAITNFLLGAWVVWKGAWHFW